MDTGGIPVDASEAMACSYAKHLTSSDSIEKTGVNARILNALQRVGIDTVGAVMALERGQIIEINDIGEKSAIIIERLQQELRNGGYDEAESSADTVPADASYAEDAPVFYDASGKLLYDIPVGELGFSRYICRVLVKAGYEFASKLIGLTAEELIGLPDYIGKRNAVSIQSTIARARFALANESAIKRMQAKGDCMEFATSMVGASPDKAQELYESLLPIFLRAQVNGEPVDREDLFETLVLRKVVAGKIVAALEDRMGGLTKEALLSMFADIPVPECAVEAGLLDLAADGTIRVGQTIEMCRPSLWEYVGSIQNDRHRTALALRLQGHTLSKIGEMLGGVTVERVRQLVKNCIVKKQFARVFVEEDKYQPIYNAYSFTKETFSLAFGTDDSVYVYMTLVCGKPGELPIEQFLEDTNYPAELRKVVERAL